MHPEQLIDACDATNPASANSGMLELHRHNLPEWLAASLKSQLGSDYWPLVDSLNTAAPLDLRVNTFKLKREEAQKELAKAGFKSEPTPYSPWGLRMQGRPPINKTLTFEKGKIEVPGSAD